MRPSLIKKYVAAAALALLASPATSQIGQSPVPPYVACTPTGAGTCNLGMVGFLSGSVCSWWWATIYNNACEEIGGVHGQLACCGPFAIDSQLPWTVDITHLPESGDYNGKYLFYLAFLLLLFV